MEIENIQTQQSSINQEQQQQQQQQQQQTTIEEEQKNTNLVSESIESHGISSYYRNNFKLSEETQKLLNKTEILATKEPPKVINVLEVKKESKNVPIANYAFMNDGVLIKVIINMEDYPELKNLSMENLECNFGSNNFKLVAKPQNTINSYTLLMERTRENIVPEKCKFYIRKDKIYISLYKEKNESWWTLKGV